MIIAEYAFKLAQNLLVSTWVQYYVWNDLKYDGLMQLLREKCFVSSSTMAVYALSASLVHTLHHHRALY